MASGVFGIRVKLGGDTSGFEKAMGAAVASVGKFAGAVAAILAPVASLSVVLDGVTEAYRRVDEQAKAARRLGLGLEEFQGLSIVAADVGTEVDALAAAMNRMHLTTDAAARGSKAAQEAFARLGLNVKDLRQLKPVEQLAAIADAMKKVQSQADRVAISRAIFGKDDTIRSLLAEGGGPIRRAADRAESLGVALDDRSARAIEAVNDNMEYLGLAVDGIFNQIAAATAPIMLVITNDLVRRAELLVHWIQITAEHLAGMSQWMGIVRDVNRLIDPWMPQDAPPTDPEEEDQQKQTNSLLRQLVMEQKRLAEAVLGAAAPLSSIGQDMRVLSAVHGLRASPGTIGGPPLNR